MPNLTGLRFEPQTSCSRNTLPFGQLIGTKCYAKSKILLVKLELSAARLNSLRDLIAPLTVGDCRAVLFRFDLSQSINDKRTADSASKAPKKLRKFCNIINSVTAVSQVLVTFTEIARHLSTPFFNSRQLRLSNEINRNHIKSNLSLYSL